MSRRKKKQRTHAFISMSIDAERIGDFDMGSIRGLPGVEEVRRTYPDDPALFNLYLAKVELEKADDVIATIRGYAPVEYAEFTEEPEPR
jgi:hypothetical protein